MPDQVDVAVVILTRGDRPDELEQALRSVAGQHGVTTERIVVWNGVQPLAVPAGLVDRHVELDENVGIPEGRNRGAKVATAPVVFFLDDDARVVDDSALAKVAELFAGTDRLGAVAMRIVTEDGHTMTRHVPRVGRRGVDEAGEVASFLGGASCIRASAFDEVGGYPGAFFYSMEETDLAWRLTDGGWIIRYEPALVVFHPYTEPSRHPDAAWRTARNRTWLAHRLLPWPLLPVYLATWFTVTAARGLARRDIAPLRAYLRGVGDGWRSRPGPRRPMCWRTVWRLSRLGRPPVV